MEMTVLDAAANGMTVQRTLLDVAARNVAAAQAGTPDHPYARLVARFSAPPDEAADSIAGLEDPDLDPAATGAPAASVTQEAGTGDALSEMIAVLDAQRAYEQNASIFDVGKRLAERTIDIGRS